MGLDVTEEHFYTSALATAAFLRDQAPGCSVFAIGEAGLLHALYAAGITMHKKLGDYVKAGESICTFYADDERLFAAAEEMYRGGLVIRSEKPSIPPLIYARVTADGVERF